MNEDSTLWELRKDLLNYKQFTTNGFSYDKLYVNLGNSPYVTLASEKSVIHINNIIRVMKNKTSNYTQYSIEHLRVCGRETPHKHIYNIRCYYM